MADGATIRLTCPACGRGAKVPAKYAGRKVRCPGCDGELAVPSAASPRAKRRSAEPAVTAAPPPHRTAPYSRTYVHDACGEATDVDGGHFKAMASPVPGSERTMCAACGEMFPIAEFRWEDTAEPIPSYYARYRARVPAAAASVCSRAAGIVSIGSGALAGIVAGVAVGAAAGVGWGVAVAVVGVPVGAAAGLALWAVGSDLVLRSALGVPDVRCLR